MSSIADGAAAVSVNRAKEAYDNRLSALQSSLAAAQRRRARARAVLLLGTALLAASLFYSGSFHFSAMAAVPFAAIALGVRSLIRARSAALEMALRCSVYERGLQRIQYDWSALTTTGEEFARPGHLYQNDLQLLGRCSVFSLLCTTRSQAGSSRLADFLLDPVSTEESRARQEAVREMLDRLDLREEISLLGKYQFQECDTGVLRNWMSTPILRIHPVVRTAMAICGSAILLLGIATLARLLPWEQALHILIPCLAVQSMLALPWIRQARRRLPLLRTLKDEFTVLRSGLALLEQQSFASPKLQSLVAAARGGPRRVRTLEQLLSAIVQAEKEVLIGIGLLIAARTQIIAAVESWRAKYQQQLERWLDAWAEFEALNALAGYAFEHPGDVFPELVDGQVIYEADNLGHPLLPPDQCVGNNLALGSPTKFYIVSGSNMAGKSTWLKAVGVNAVLARAGAPVRASRARISCFAVGASSSIGDSLADGKSRFLAEAERLRAILGLSNGAQPVLFLVDEILSGTNSRDRRIACGPIVHSLLKAGAVGLLSTHDLALTEIADASGLGGANVCMESPDADNPLRFDYRVRPGIPRSTSALAILSLLEIDVGRDPTLNHR